MEKSAEAMQETHVSVFFGASKYPTRPEVWVHLYQTILREATGSFFSRLRLGFRLGLLKVGWWPLVLAVFMASFSLFTRLGWAVHLLGYVIGGMGIGLLVILGYGYRILAKGRLLQEKYAFIPDHADKLGLQAVIGDDLERLLRAWFPTRASPHTRPVPGKHQDKREETKPEHRDNKKNGNEGCDGIWKRLVSYFADPDIAIDFRMGRWGWFFMLLCRLLAGIGCWELGQNVWATVPGPTGEGSTAWRWGGVTLIGVFYGFLVAAAFVIGRIDTDRKRVLLVVDDLDRCEPEQSLSVIESIRWFLDNPKVNSRLHVAILMERDALETACRLRAREHGKEYSDDAWRTRFEALREKLFMVELSLPTLKNDEVSDLAHRLLYGKPPRKAEPPASSLPRGPAQTSAGDPSDPKNSAVGAMSPGIPGAELPPKDSTEAPVIEPDLVSPAPARATQDSGIRSYHPWPFAGGPPAAPVAAQQQTLAPPPHSSPTPKPSKSSLSEHFSEDERTKLEEVFRSIPPEHLTPRSVRAALFRYLFARQLLSGVDFSPQDLMEHLAHAMFAGASKPNFKARHSMEIARVISQLT
ncbi:hypothetical protein BGE01nite_37690 [Brevifollis gellanilyticus]|uniref:KAP NTPase domain-containing protein n=2 Tax=Brevifollis gellanilyticus TaxID=748831 RepID=A0A512MCM7_9BACT|nr:hypothetical protein BGE01nite_37690 [Brevifollis gellanilyticus]